MKHVTTFLLLTMLTKTGQSLVCYAGTRDLVDGSPQNSLFYGVECNITNEHCAIATYPSTASGVPVIKEHAGCRDSSYNMTCESTAFLSGVVDPTGCSTKYCKTDGCNIFTQAEGCQASSATELQVAPSCTLREVINKFEFCSRNFLAGFPYSDVSVCKGNIDSGLQCLAQALVTCVTGPCMTDLDLLPFGLSFIMPMIPQYAMSFASTASLFSLMGVPPTSQNDVIGTICLHPDSEYTQQIGLLFEAMSLNLTYENPFCDSQVLPEILEWHLQALPRLIYAESHSTWCRFSDDSKAMMLDLWENRCNKSAAVLVPEFVLPPGYEFLSQKLEYVVTTLENFARNYQLPGCGGLSLQSSDSDNSVYFDDDGNSSDGIHAKNWKLLRKLLFSILAALAV